MKNTCEVEKDMILGQHNDTSNGSVDCGGLWRSFEFDWVGYTIYYS